MGAIGLPAHGTIYLDTNGIIYSIERVEPYRALLQPLWEKAHTGAVSLITSDLTLLEALVGPFKAGNKLLETEFRDLLQHSPDIRLLPISHAILERGASLRTATSLKTPDAINAATALVAGCELFVTNDLAFKRVPGLAVAVLSEVVAAP